MGEVYRARDTRLGRDVALKILPDHLANHSDRRARFENEARAASALNYPGIVTIHDIGNAEGVAYLVTEFIDGASLRGSRPDTLRRQLDVAAQVAEALAAAHAAGITHRDLKPENIMITRDGRVKILDFGLASQTTSPSGEETLTAMTMPGTILGTVGYMSPEQARGRAADARSDIFSLGAVMYELFSGHRAFGGESPADVLSAVLKSDPPELPSSVPPGARQIVDRCLDKDPACRFQSSQDLAFALRAVAGSSLTGVTSPAIVERPPMKTKKVRWPLAAMGAAVLVLGVGFWRLATEPQVPDMSRYRLRPFAAEDEPERLPVWSPDGKSIAYVIRRKAKEELNVKSLDGSPPVALWRSERGGVHSLSWTPDSSKLYCIHGGLYGTVLSVARAGGEPQQARGGLAFAAALSPHGSTLAALMREESNGQPQSVLTLSSPDGTGEKRIKTFPGWALQNRVAWSPDSSKIAVWVQHQEFWVVDAGSGAAKSFEIPRPGAIWFNFAWLDNRQIIVSWPRTDDVVEARTDLWALDTGTGRMTLIFRGTEALTDPTVSPDGNSLAFTNGALDFDLMELPLDGGPPRPLRATGQWEDSADWSPVAPEFVYVTWDGIRLRSKDGSRDRLIVTRANFPGKPIRFVAPSFSPDGTRIAYTTVESGRRAAWISPVSGGAPAPLGEFAGPWSPDGRWMAALPTSGLAKVRVGSGEKPIMLASQRCGFIPSWSPDGSRILCSADGVLFTVSAEGGPPEFLGKEYAPIAVWSRDIRYIYAIRNADGKRELGKLEWKRGTFQPIVDVPEEWGFNTPAFGAVRLSLSSDGKSLATTVIRYTGDIWILDGFQPPPTLWQRLLRH
jgi:serine/threonine protein kinase